MSLLSFSNRSRSEVQLCKSRAKMLGQTLSSILKYRTVRPVHWTGPAGPHGTGFCEQRQGIRLLDEPPKPAEQIWKPFM
ncbi:hypothetical protein KFK09_001474 [Dendrobium nobile]|uniref:Uncharacterized protein n=1 Tax=Dendrobium nobile TaxID=94219 RepID=A0A8T3C527_DENNO|nr:hypothetical protein KFK09_001474 [Dendrobium nobile]